MKKYEYAVCGGAGLNKFVFVNHTPRVGITSHATNEDFDELYFGGTGLNISYCLMKLGAKVLPVLAHSSGEYKSQELKELLENVNSPLEAIEEPVKGASGYGMLIKDKDGNHITIICHKNNKNPPKRPMKDKWFEDSEMGVVSIAIPHNVVEFVARCKKNNVPLVFSMRADPFTFPKPVMEEILLYSSIIFANDAEKKFAEELYGWQDITDLFKIANAQIIVITHGKDGCTINTLEDGAVKKEYVPASKSDHVIDQTGAGDSFVAGFLYGYKRGKNLRTCAQWGSTMAAFIIEKTGCITNVPTLEEMLARNALREDAGKEE